MEKLPFLIVLACLGFLGLSCWFLVVTDEVEARGSGAAPPAEADDSADVAEVRAMLDSADASVRREGAARLAASRAIDSELARRLLVDSDVEVRRTVVDFLARVEVPGRVELLAAAIRDPAADVVVRATSAAALVRIQSEETIPYMIEYLEDEDPYIRLYAIQILEGLTGDSLGYQPFSPSRARDAKAEEWRRWWAARTSK